MCGIFGAIGRPNPAILRALAIANRERGTHSLGFFKSNGKLMKRAGDPINVLPEFSEFIDDPKAWFIVGHTRYATRGKKTQRNAHPFRRGRIIGAHNGIVDAPKHYKVDSEYLIDRLNQESDYQTALEDISGYWGLVWFNGADLYLACHDNELSVVRDKRAIYFSSDDLHLSAATGLYDVWEMQSGEVLRFDMKLAARRRWQRCKDFVSKAYSLKKDSRTSGGSYSCKYDIYEKDFVVDIAGTSTFGEFEASGAIEDYEYLEKLCEQLGFAGVDEAMSWIGCTNFADAIDELESEIDRVMTYWSEDEDSFRKVR